MKHQLFIFISILFAFNVFAEGPVHLALVTESPEAAAAADALSVQLSNNPKIQLLERDKIQEVFQEQERSTGNLDDLKLGRILGADGLLILNVVQTQQRTELMLRLVAVKPGVVLANLGFAWPIEKPVLWAEPTAAHLNSFLSKLALTSGSAIPISVVNFHSSIQSADASLTEKEIKWLTIQRLSREPQLFVMERSDLQSLSEEKYFNSDETKFWDGRYVLEGNIDQNGYSAETVTMSARLTPPEGGKPLLIEASGSRTNFAEVVNQLASKITEALKINPAVKEWNSSDEAEQFVNDATWALKWGAPEEAQSASEAAWALGKTDAGTAMLRIRSYSASVPPGEQVHYVSDLVNSDISANAVPDANHFKPLSRALELFQQNGSQVLDCSNSDVAANFLTGLDLLHKSAGLLESYYYAAELRPPHEEQLVDLREKARGTLKVFDEHLSSNACDVANGDDLRQKYQWFKWEEGGICVERPADTVPLIQQLLESGYQPKNLPRMVGWSWEDRQRVAGLRSQMINEACDSTNPAVQLEGFYMALLQVPVDEKDVLARRENDLYSAIWANRQWLFQSPENASLVMRVEESLEAMCQFYSTGYFDHEPFASFYHQLRMDLLRNATEAELPVIRDLFPNTNVKLETAEQARELLPLMAADQQKFNSTPLLNSSLEHLRYVARTASQPVRAAVPEIPRAPVLEAKFIKWNLPIQNLETNRCPNFRGMIFRNGKLWVRVGYVEMKGAPPELKLSEQGDQIAYLAIDPVKGVEKEIPFPAAIGVPDDAFEVSEDSLFVNAQGAIYRYKFQDNNWEKIPAPVEDISEFVWIKDRLFVSRSDGLLEINPDTKEVRVLASSRRQPSVSDVDPLWKAQTQIYARADGKLGLASYNYCFAFDPGSARWEIRTNTLTGTNDMAWALFASADGAQLLVNDPMARPWLLGYENDDRPLTPLLLQPRSGSPEPVPMPLSPEWNWPPDYWLEPSSILVESNGLWVLCPRKSWQMSTFPIGQEPVKFSDNRQATLFYFVAGSREPLSVPIHFEEREDALAEPIRLNDQPVDMFSPFGGGYSGNWERLGQHFGINPFWVKTQEGLIYGAPNYCGHWLIPNSALQTMFAKPVSPLAPINSPTP